MTDVKPKPSSGFGDASSNAPTLTNGEPGSPHVISDDEKEAGSAAVSDITYPEGGLRAWSVVVGAALLAFSTFGLANAWGVFQEYYSRTLLRHESPSNIAWIGSVQYSLIFLPGVLSGRLTDRGYLHTPMLIASAIMITAVFLTAECKEFWQFMLCQGVAVGLSAGFLFGPFAAIVSHWFQRKRALAFGLVACGTSVGGVIFPIAVRKLLPQVGFPWTMRIMGFLILFTLSIALCLVRLRLPPQKIAGGMFNFAIFKSVAFSLYAFASFVSFLGIYTVLTYIDVAATQAGINSDTAFYLVAIANGTSAFGRLTAAYLSIEYGAMNLLMPFTIGAGVLTWAWPYANDTGKIGSLYAIAVIYGICSGALLGVLATPMGNPAFGAQGDIGRRIGMLWTVCAIGALVGPPIAGAINTASHGWHAVGWYAGSACVACVALMLISKKVAIGTWLGKI